MTGPQAPITKPTADQFENGSVLYKCLTRDFSFKRAADDMLRSSVFDGDEVAAGGHGCVRDLVTLGTLLAVHLHLGGSVNGDRESASSSVDRVYDEFRGNTLRRQKE